MKQFILPIVAILVTSAPALGSFVMTFEDITNGGMAVIVDNRPNGYVYDGTNSSDTNDDNWTGPNYADGLIGIIETPVGLHVGNFDITFAAGFGADPTTPDGLIDLNLSVLSTGAGTLVARLTKTDFTTFTREYLVSHIGGTLDSGASLTYTSGLDPAAGHFVMAAGSTTSPYTVSGGSNTNFDDTRMLQFNPVSSFSLSQEFVITATGAGQTVGFDAELTARVNAIPEPSSLVTFAGLALMGMGLIRSRARVR